MFMIPDDILDILTCGKCKKYLSFRPVKVYPNRDVLCGRCSIDSDNGLVSIYDSLARQGLFRCINRYEGCDKLLKYAEVPRHENTCISSHFECPICLDSKSFSSLTFLHHFKRNHSNIILSFPRFEISRYEKENPKIFLYVVNDFIFLISIFMFQNLNCSTCIDLNIIHLAAKTPISDIYQKFILYRLTNGKNENKHVTRKMLCSPYSNKLKNKITVSDYKIEATEILVVEFAIDIKYVKKLIVMPSSVINDLKSDDIIDNNIIKLGFEKIIDSHKILSPKKKITFMMTYLQWLFPNYKVIDDRSSISNFNRKIGFCCNCQNIFIDKKHDKVYKCSCPKCLQFNNLLCSNCFFFGVTSCVNGNNNSYIYAQEETDLFKFIQYSCQWKCDEPFKSWQFKDHQEKCSRQASILCPVRGCINVFGYGWLHKHIAEHSDVIYYPNNICKTNAVFSNKIRNYVILPILNHFISFKWVTKCNMFYCSFLNVESNCLDNMFPMACFKKNNKIVYYKNNFYVDSQFMIILAKS